MTRKIVLSLLTAMALLVGAAGSASDDKYWNPKIDMRGFLRNAEQAADIRESHRVTEDEFIEMMKDPATVVLDARSHAKYDLLHVKGAVNLSFPDISISTLEKMFPDKTQRILIYCNNNFVGDEEAFPGKDASASLNLSTFVTLTTYGYTNVWELAPLLDVGTTRIPLVGSRR